MIKVKRDGPRGWHWIADEHYDPAVHEIVRDEAIQETELEPAPQPKKRTRKKP